MRLAVLIVFGFFFAVMGAVTEAQTPIKDISAVFAEGKVEDNQYKNDYFGLTLTPIGAEFTQGGFVSSQGKRARLIDAQANAKNWEDKYSIAIITADGIDLKEDEKLENQSWAL